MGRRLATCPDELLPHFNIDFDEIYPHDESVLPHLHEFEYAFRMFPKIEVGEPQPNLDDWTPGDIERCDMSNEVAQLQKPMKKRGNMRVGPSDAFREQ